MTARRIVALTGILAVSILLAFPLRDAMYEMVIVPAAYVWWLLGLLYRAVDQSFWWVIALALVLIALARTLLPAGGMRNRIRLKPRPVVGQVENLSGWVKRTERGIYFKWLVANRLGRIAHEILARRLGVQSRAFFDPLEGPDWSPRPSVRAYLETGLGGSFADYPQNNVPFSRPAPTPLDHDVSEVIAYLESQTGAKGLSPAADGEQRD